MFATRLQLDINNANFENDEVRINIFVHEHNNHNSQKGFFLNTKNLMFFTRIESGF